MVESPKQKWVNIPSTQAFFNHDGVNTLDCIKDENLVAYCRLFSVLLVEDIPLIQKFSCNILKTLGCQVTLARNATQAYEFSKRPHDLIFMDISLPDGDGLTLIHKIKLCSRNQNTPIVVLTACDIPQVKMACFEAGVDGFIAKPASYETLQKCILKYRSLINT